MFAGMFTVIGDVLVDLVGTPARFTAHAGGSAYNVAITLGRLGRDVALIARSGRDVFGQLLEDKARASGVAFDRWEVVDEPTTLAVASLADDGSASYDFYIDGTAGMGWDERLVDLAPTGGVLHLGSIASWRPPSGPLLQALQQRAYDAGATLVSYDPNVRPALIADRTGVRTNIERCVSAAHLVKASNEDIAYLYPDQAVSDVAAWWTGLGATLVVVTFGEDGAVAYGRDGEVARRGGESIVVADTVGAGDAFAGGLLSALVDAGIDTPDALAAIAPDQVEAALAQAVLVSALTCERRGADPPTRAEVAAR